MQACPAGQSLASSHTKVHAPPMHARDAQSVCEPQEVPSGQSKRAGRS